MYYIKRMDVFKEIPDYNGDYQISNLGEVKSFKNNKELILSPCINTFGYKVVHLCKEGKPKTFKIHQLVAMAFLNHKPCGYNKVINHIDFNKLNNNVDNIEITTQRKNSNKKHIKSLSKYVGVVYAKHAKKWKAQIMINKKVKYLGYFNNEYDAHISYQNKIREIV